MSLSPSISLIDLSDQLLFEIDDELKTAICFGETLIVSCCHVEGYPDESETSWSVQSSISSIIGDEPEEKEEIVLPTPEQEVVADDIVPLEPKESFFPDEDFHFFFFDDHAKLDQPLHKDISVITTQEIPEINPRRRTGVCLCRSDDEVEPRCKCHLTACTCGAKSTRTCKCDANDDICVCHPFNEPSPVCECGDNKDICACFPDNKPRPFCVCDKPCKCSTETDAICICGALGPCTCHPAEKEPPCECPVPICECGTHNYDPNCRCPATQICLCSSENALRKLCTCDDPGNCVCSGTKKDSCTCNDPEPCVCTSNIVADCPCNIRRSIGSDVKEPCICESPCVCHDEDKCICETSSDKDAYKYCVCSKAKKERKIKKIGYVECSYTDPKHNFFGYGYRMHSKFDKRPLPPEKLVIKGLDQKTVTKTGSCHCQQKPTYEKKRPRKFSLDCCSATGGISIIISTLGIEKDRFLVQVESNFSRQGAKYSTKITSIADCKLHTLEENRHEHMFKTDSMKERKHYMAICTTGYYNKITQVSGEKKKIKRLYHTFEESHDFILEGSNLILLRYMALRRYKGKVKTKTVLMGGTVCECVYISHGTTQAVINNKPISVLKIDRQIIEPCGIMHEAKIVMGLKGDQKAGAYLGQRISIAIQRGNAASLLGTLPHPGHLGRLIHQEWSDSNYILHINPLLNINPDNDDIEETPPLRRRWREDMQLMSDFLEFKGARSSEHTQYLEECEPLRSLMKDYLKAVLLLKPADALHFTRHYFGNALSSLDLPHDDYFDQSQRRVRYYDYED